jgi:hypothetical protein
MGMVFGLALRQTEGLIGSVVGLLGLDLAVPDHSTLSRRAKTLEVPRLRRAGTDPLHLLVDSTGLRLGGAGECLVEKHGASRCRSWRELHIGVDAAGGEIVAVAVTRKGIDDAAMADALLDEIADPIASFTADSGYDQDQVSQAVAERHPDAAIIVPPRAGGVASASGETAPTQHDRHLRMIADRGQMAWQKASGAMYRYKTNIGRRLHARTLPNQRTEAKIGCNVLNRMTSPRHASLCSDQMIRAAKRGAQPEVCSCTNAPYRRGCRHQLPQVPSFAAPQRS